VWTIVNIEEWDIEKPMARQYLTAPQGVTTVPDVPNWAWHDYGMRVGFWRLLDALTKHKIRATTSINAHVVESYAPVAQAMLDAGWEFMAHGVIQGAMHLLPDQRAAIRQSIELLKAFTGKKPKGCSGRASRRPGRRSTISPRRASSTSRLGQRRQPYRDPHHGRAARLGALHARAERHPDDGDPAPRVVGVVQRCEGPVRPPLRGGARNRA
jgi:peptidoglycan/xylan/chitin deacetylase (PgdA/CDA1 family)